MQNKQLIQQSNQKSLSNNNNEATKKEKDVALAKIDEAAKQAKAATDAATTNNAVDEATKTIYNYFWNTLIR